MTTKTQKVFKEAIRLSPLDRAALLEGIFSSFDRPGRSGIDAAWAREVEARLDAYESGALKAVPAKDVFGQVGKR